MSKKKLQILKEELEKPVESEINSENLETTTIFKKVVQLPTIKLKAGDQGSTIKGIKEEVASDKEEAELLSLRLTVLRI